MVVYGFIPSNPPLSPLYIYRYTPVDNPLYWPPGIGEVSREASRGTSRWLGHPKFINNYLKNRYKD